MHTQKFQACRNCYKNLHKKLLSDAFLWQKINFTNFIKSSECDIIIMLLVKKCAVCSKREVLKHDYSG